jgi:hypothetical protein
MFPTNPSAHPIIHPIMQTRVLDVRRWAILPLDLESCAAAARRHAPENRKIRTTRTIRNTRKIRDGRVRVPTRHGCEGSRKPYRAREARLQNSKTPRSESNLPTPHAPRRLRTAALPSGGYKPSPRCLRFGDRVSEAQRPGVLASDTGCLGLGDLVSKARRPGV